MQSDSARDPYFNQPVPVIKLFDTKKMIKRSGNNLEVARFHPETVLPLMESSFEVIVVTLLFVMMNVTNILIDYKIF